MRMRGIPGARNAAVHDRPDASRPLDPKHRVVLFAIDGSPAPGASGKIESIVESVFGIDKGSVRVSVENAALSLAFDPQPVALAAVLRILDQKLAALRLALLPVRVVDDSPSEELKAIAERTAGTAD